MFPNSSRLKAQLTNTNINDIEQIAAEYYSIVTYVFI